MKLMVYNQKKCWVFWMFFRVFLSKKWWLIDKYGKFQPVPAISLDVLLYQSISHLSNLSMRGSHIIYQVAALAGTTQVTFPTLKSQYDATVPLHVSQSCKTPWSSQHFWKWCESGDDVKWWWYCMKVDDVMWILEEPSITRVSHEKL